MFLFYCKSFLNNKTSVPQFDQSRMKIQKLFIAKEKRILNVSIINPLMPGGKKRSHILKQTYTWKLQVCLSMCDLFVTTGH